MTTPKSVKDIATNMKSRTGMDASPDGPIIDAIAQEIPNVPQDTPEWQDNPQFNAVQNQVVKIILTGGNIQEDAFMAIGSIVGTLSMLKSQSVPGIEVNGVEALEMLLKSIKERQAPEAGKNSPPPPAPSNDLALVLQGMQAIAARLDSFDARLAGVESK